MVDVKGLFALLTTRKIHTAPCLCASTIVSNPGVLVQTSHIKNKNTPHGVFLFLVDVKGLEPLTLCV